MNLKTTAEIDQQMAEVADENISLTTEAENLTAKLLADPLNDKLMMRSAHVIKRIKYLNQDVAPRLEREREQAELIEGLQATLAKHADALVDAEQKQTVADDLKAQHEAAKLAARTAWELAQDHNLALQSIRGRLRKAGLKSEEIDRIEADFHRRR